jgi:hypothetical protein
VAQKPITVDGLHTARVAMDAGGKHVIAAAADSLLCFDTATGKQVSSQPGTVDLFDVSSRMGDWPQSMEAMCSLVTGWNGR